MSWGVWLAFLAASVVIAVTPGPGAIMSMASGLSYGYATALRGIMGLQTALLIQLVMVALGLGAVLAASSTAFLVLKVMGALYLVYMGVKKWRAPVEVMDAEKSAPSCKDNLYMQGVLVNLTNPKALIFMVAFVPQFIDQKLAQWPQFLVIATTMIAVDMAVMSCYALLARRCRVWLHRPDMLRTQNRVFGSLFVSAGALLALSSRT